MSVLVTGSSGFTGSYIARHLAEMGLDVTGTYRRETEFLKRVRATPNLRLQQVDLVDVHRLSGAFSSIVHIAATSPASGISNERIVRDNVLAMLTLLDAAQRWKSRRFVFFSSLSIYGEVGVAVVDEATPIINPDTYGATKHICEALLSERSRELPGIALRLPGVLGPGAHRNWLSGIAEKLRTGASIKAFNLCAPFNNAAHLSDVSQLVAGLMARDWQEFDALVLGAAGAISVQGAIERLAAGLGAAAKIEEIAPLKPGFMLSSARAVERWGYAPTEIGAMIDKYARELAGT